MEDNKAFVAIIAEMRAARNAASDTTLVPTEWLTQWASRIEAAAMRERVEREFAHKKVEEALSDEIAIRDEKIKQSAPGNAAREALARNCDRFATADEARRAFESAHSHGIVHNLYTAAFDWLFDKAEGGDHA